MAKLFKTKAKTMKKVKKTKKASLKSKTKIKKEQKTKIKRTKITENEESSGSEVEDLLENEDLSDADSSDIVQDENEKNEAASSDEEEQMDDEALAEKHKRDLAKLKETDPEFYKFLQENDKKLLDFNMSDEENEADDHSMEVEEDKDEYDSSVHKPSADLEVASDEDDFEAEDDKEEQTEKTSGVVTLKLIKKWQADIQTDKSKKTILEVTQAFHAALVRISSPEEQDQEVTQYRVEGSSVFNAVIQLCVLELGPAIRRFLGLKSGSKQPPHKCKKFNKIKGILKTYFLDLLKLLVGVTSSNIQTVLLKHLHYLCPMLNSYQNITKSILKKLISLWGSADDSVRVLAFFCILRITNNQMQSMLDTTLKSMYMTYVKNSKFVSKNSLAPINFMKRSLTEMFTLDVNVTYSHVFLYVRQLAIHLRNAITVNKKENTQAVYNWQFVNSLRLWGNLLAVMQNKPQIQQLVYPFVQVCLGTIKLVPTAQYYPLRFHIVQILIEFSKDTGVFVPVLPFLLEVLTSYDFNKKHQKLSMKPMHFMTVLRLSKSQLQENGFKDAVIDMIYGQLLEYLAAQSHTIAFPDLSLFCILQIKQFLKKCRVANYTRKLKQVLDKVEQSSKFIEDERSKVTFNLTDFKQIEGWESQIKAKGTPLTTYYESWNKLRNIKKNKALTESDEISDFKLPTLNKHAKKAAKSKDSGPVELFPSDSEDEVEDEEASKPRRGKRGGKKHNWKKQGKSGPVEDNGVKDIVEDIELDDW